MVTGGTTGQRKKRPIRTNLGEFATFEDAVAAGATQSTEQLVSGGQSFTPTTGTAPEPERTQTTLETAPVASGQNQIIRSQETGRPSGIRTPSGNIFLGLSPREVFSVAANRQAKGEAIVEARDVGARQRELELAQGATTQGAQLNEQLTRDIQNPPNLAPEPVGEVLRQAAPPELLERSNLNLIKLIKGEMSLDSALNELKRGITQAGVAGVAAGAIFALASTGTAVTASLLAKSSSLVSSRLLTFGVGALAASGLGKVTGFRGGQIDSLKGEIEKVGGIVSAYKGYVDAGGDPNTAIRELRQMSNSVDEAEATIRQLGALNLEFRTSKEYIDVMQEIVAARADIREATQDVVLAAQNPPDVRAYKPEELVTLLTRLEQ